MACLQYTKLKEENPEVLLVWYLVLQSCSHSSLISVFDLGV